MIKQLIGKYEGRNLYLCQIVSVEERTEYKVPEGMSSWWEVGDDGKHRIYDPLTIIDKLREGPVEKSDMGTYIERLNVRELHATMVRNQTEEHIKSLENMLVIYRKNKVSKDTIAYIEEQLRLFKADIVPLSRLIDVDGVVRASVQDARKFVGDEKLADRMELNNGNANYTR